MNWYQKTAQAVLSELGVKAASGLSGGQVVERTHAFGKNVLSNIRQETLAELFLSQFKSPLIYILLFAALAVTLAGDFVDALVILMVITINSVVGTVQEGRARNSLARLRVLIRHKAFVKRAGEEFFISVDELVPGDILILRAGDKVGADGRIIKEESLKIDESVLTGEAYSVEKISGVLKKDGLTYGDQKNMVFSGTSVVAGYAEVVVVATGLQSELGKISKELQETSNIPLPLVRKVEKLTHFIAIAVFVIAVLVFVIGFLRGIETKELFGAVVGMVVSLIPEGLPVAVTIVLAHGVWRMAKSKAIVRQMAAVEAMGNADTLMVDKTGTITTGKMVIRRVFLGGEKYEVTGDGYEPEGEIESKVKVRSGESKVEENLSLKDMLGLVYLSLKANVLKDEHGDWKPVGDPTEAAISVLCKKAGLNREKLQKEYKTIVAKPFDQEKRYIEAVFETCLPASLRGRSWPAGRENGKKFHVFVGAPDFLNKKLKVDHGFSKNYHDLAKEGLRVVGVAIFGTSEKKLLGNALLAIDEEIRISARGSILEAKKAGLKICMLSGDYPETAKEIARKVGIFTEGDEVLTGEDVEKLSIGELSQKTGNVSVFARITPEHKLKIVRAFQSAGKVCAMTGDGVNDAPALQAANLGICVGSGTQVAKDASDIVLVDDNFETIVTAISEGRAIYLTLKKVILYLFSTSFGEALVLVGAIVIGLPLPLVAVQIIWLNFVTDGFFVVALAAQKPKAELISKEELKSSELVDSLMVQRIITMGLSMIIALPVFYYFLNNYSLDYARTMALLVLAATQWFNSLNVRSRYVSVFKKGMDNPYIVFSFIIVFALQILIIETVWGNRVMHTTGLTFLHWVLALALSTSVIWVEEARKIFFRGK